MKTLTKAVAIASLVSASALTAQVANAEVSASAAISNMYLWRGQNLSAGSGAAAMSGSLDYANESGLYAGIWGSSGDAGGTETDLYVGFAGEAGSIGYDIGYATYLYPGEDDIDESAEFYVSASFDAFSATAYIPSDSDSDYRYIVLGAEMGDYSFALGQTIDNTDDDFPGVDADYTHVDVTYAYNDKVSFTYSQIVDEATEGYADMGGQFAVTYSLPIE